VFDKQPLFTVTPGAKARLASKLTTKKATSAQALRFVRRPGGWQLRLDGADPADTKFTHDGRTVLLLDADVTRKMKSKTLDIRQTSGGPRLTLSDSDPQKGL